MFFLEKLNSRKKRQFCLAVLAYANLLHCTPSTFTKTLQLTKIALLLSTKKTEIAEASNPGVLYILAWVYPKPDPHNLFYELLKLESKLLLLSVNIQEKNILPSCFKDSILSGTPKINFLNGVRWKANFVYISR